MAKEKHIHKLKKHKYAKTNTSIFFCTLPSCHYKVEVPLALGKEAICNICDEVFIMNEYTLKLVRPHCSNCGRKEVKTSDGKKMYVNKRSSAVLQEVAANDVNNLRNRLDSLMTKDDEI